jgi:predicted acyltransferase
MRLGAIALALCAGYWLWMTKVPTPGGVTGDLSPDGNWGGYVDRAVFGTQHLWSQSKTWDPGGILSTIPAIAAFALANLAVLYALLAWMYRRRLFLRV